MTAAFVTINTSTPSLAMMIGLAVGIDYALFLVARHRHQLRAGWGRGVGRPVGGHRRQAVIFAGITVVIALCGLVVARIPFLTVMGLAGAAAVTVAVAVAVTLVPAMLGLAGERLRPRPEPRRPQRGREPGETHTLGARWVAAGDPGAGAHRRGGGRRPAADRAARPRTSRSACTTTARPSPGRRERRPTT